LVKLQEALGAQLARVRAGVEGVVAACYDETTRKKLEAEAAERERRAQEEREAARRAEEARAAERRREEEAARARDAASAAARLPATDFLGGFRRYSALFGPFYWKKETDLLWKARQPPQPAAPGGAIKPVPVREFKDSENTSALRSLWECFEARARQGAAAGSSGAGGAAAAPPPSLVALVTETWCTDKNENSVDRELEFREWIRCIARRPESLLPHRGSSPSGEVTTEGKLRQIREAAGKVAARLSHASSAAEMDYLCDFVLCQVVAFCTRCYESGKVQSFDVLGKGEEALRPSAMHRCDVKAFTRDFCRGEVYFNAALLLRVLFQAHPPMLTRYNALLLLLCPDLGGGGGAATTAASAASASPSAVENRLSLSLALIHGAMLGMPQDHWPAPPGDYPYPSSEAWKLLARWKAELFPAAGGGGGGGEAPWHGALTLSRLQALSAVLQLAGWTLRRDYGLQAANELLRGLRKRFSALKDEERLRLNVRLGQSTGNGRPSDYADCVKRHLEPEKRDGDSAPCLLGLPPFAKPTEWLRSNVDPAPVEEIKGE